MKKMILYPTAKLFIVIILILGGITLTAAPARATGLGIGFTAWYNWFDPYWKNISDGAIIRTKQTIKPNFLYGPMIALKLPKHIRINSMFMMGDYTIQKKGYIFLYSAYPIRGESSMRRYDSDTSLGVSLNKYFSLIIGFKFSRYSFKQSEITTFAFNSYTMEINKKTYNDYAPALGFSVIAPLYKKSLFLLYNLSAIYCFSDTSSQGYLGMFSLAVTPIILPNDNKVSHFGKVGLNTTLSLAYYIEPADVSLMMGYRYQAMMLVLRDKSYSNVRTLMKMDHFHGITAGVIYTLEFEKLSGKKKEESDG